MPLLRWRTISSLSLALLIAVAAAGARAETLGNLFQGGSIAVGNLSFSNWQLTSLETVGGGIANLNQINVLPLSDDPLNPGLGIMPIGSALSTPPVHSGVSSVLLKFSFEARTISAAAPIEGYSLQLVGYEFQSRPDALIRIIEDIRGGSGELLNQSVVITFRDDPPDSPLLSDSVDLLPRSSLRVDLQIDVYAQLSNDVVKLTSFEMRFLQDVPEPGSLLLLGVASLCALARRSRHRQAGLAYKSGRGTTFQRAG
jgi:hypothetical protein